MALENLRRPAFFPDRPSIYTQYNRRLLIFCHTDPTANYVVFSDHLGAKEGIFYLHGALHLFEKHGEVRKHCWNRSGVSITDNVKAALLNDDFPLFVAEGDSTKKLEMIQSSGYLSYCFQKLQRLGANLVVCGSALGDSDEHILRAIGDADFSTVWLGVYGDCDSAAAKHMEVVATKLLDRRKKNRGKPLEVKFFDVRTAPIWGALPAKIDPKSVTAATMAVSLVPNMA